jgi:hypothetical protein
MKFAAFAAFAFVLNSYAGDLPTDFQLTLQQTKGPFGQNVLQGPTERISVTAGRVPEGFLFQAAYRNDLARALIANHDFYLANLFTTNYYELMGEYVYGDPYGTHPIDHAALAAKAPAALPKATSMIRNWVLEKFYIEQRPSSKLARSFKIRGISSYETEQVFAKYFFNFYLGAIDEDYQYLPAFLLATRSPVFDSTSLARARNLITLAYDEVALALGAEAPLVKALWKIRNSIHNQLTPAVIGEIDQFLKTYPEYRSIEAPPTESIPPTAGPQTPAPRPRTPAPGEFFTAFLAFDGRTDLDEIRSILVEYYSFSPKRLAEQAAKCGQKDLKAAADAIIRQGVNADRLLNLSALAAAKRELLAAGGSIPYDKRAEVLALLANVSLYVRKEISGLSNVRSAKVVEAAVNAVYIEGFLIRDNWVYFKTEIANSTDWAKLLTDVVEIAGESSLQDAFGPALGKWRLIDRKMETFIDHTLKSSAVDTASLLVRRLKPE